MSNAMCSRFSPPAGWGDSRHTHPAVTQAIFALSTDDRAPEIIWENPTADEWISVTALVAEYIKDGDFELSNGRFAWGPFETLRFKPVAAFAERRP